MTFLYLIAVILLLIPVLILYPIEVLGKKRKPKGKLILVSNHMTGADPFLLAAHHNRQIYFLGKSEFTKNSKFVRTIFKWLGVISIDRGKPDLTAIKAVINRLNQGKTVGIYPEGTRNYKNEDIQPLKSGSVMFALKTDAPVVPMILWRRPKMFRKNIFITGDPVDLSEFKDQKLNNEVLAKADEVLYDYMLKLHKTVRYYAELKGKQRKELKRKLNDKNIKFIDIYNELFKNNINAVND
ncbi:MAG TPA: lysophospholipid acyltransferase family protein [Clostridia bacterium]